MDIRQLEYFLQIVKDKSITKAAENLYITQPALSKAIKNLEEGLEVELYIKTPHGIELTEYGIQLAESAAPLVNAFNHIQEQLHDVSEHKKGHVNIGVGPMFGFAYISAILSSFRKQYPNIEVNLHILSAKKIKAMLPNYELDIGIFNKPQLGDNLENMNYVLIHQDVMVAVCNKNHHLSQKPYINMSDLRNETFNICSGDYAMHDTIIEYCHQASFDPKINFECNSIELLLDMTASGKGICLLPRPYVKRISICFPSNRILMFKPAIPWTSCMATRYDAYSSYSSMVLSNFIKKYFRENYPTDNKLFGND